MRSISCLLSILLSGCVGFVTAFPETRTRDRPEGFEATWATAPTKVVSDRGEIWTYESGGEWCGVMPMLIVPIPLMLPVCTQREVIEFEGAVARRSTSTQVESGGFACGLFGTSFNGGGGPGCTASP